MCENIDDLINWSNLSKMLTGNRFSIRRTAIPERYRSQISTVRRQLEEALNEFVEIEWVDPDYVPKNDDMVIRIETVDVPVTEHIIDSIPDKFKAKVTTASEMDDWFLIDSVPKYKAEGYDTKYYQGKWYAKRK